MCHLKVCLFLPLTLLLLIGCAEPPLSPRSPTPGVPHIKVVSFNVNLNEYDDRPTVQAVGQEDADIVCLQETNSEWEAVLRAEYSDRYPHMIFRHDGEGAGGLAVMSRYPLYDDGFHEGLDDWHPAWHIRADSPMGQIQILQVHLKPPISSKDGVDIFNIDQVHHTEISQFQGECSDELPTLVLGDFNEGPDGSAIEYLEDRGFRNILPLFRPGQNTWKYTKGYLGQTTETLDHILFDVNFVPLNSYVIDEGNSDHYGVVALFERPPRDLASSN